MSEKLTRRGFLAAVAAGTAAMTATRAMAAAGAKKGKGGGKGAGKGAKKGAGKKAAPGQNASSAARVVGANSLIRIGQIGCGNRGIGTHLKTISGFLGDVNHAVVAVADPWRLAREEAAAKAKEYYGTEAKQFVSYRDLLELKDVDAVMIASPDHLHTTHLEAAALAKKHIYCEKPMGIDIAKTVRACDAAKAAGTVVQIGTQLRSMPASAGSRAVLASGILGKISRIEECRNGEKPYWYGHLEKVPLVKKEDLDWKEFLGDAPDQPYDPRKYAAWYGYYEFSQGPVPQWAAHFIDLMHFMTGCGFPETCVCLGGTYTWNDENKFTAPDHVQALWTYPDGFMVSYSTNFGNGFGNTRKVYCDKGTLKFDNWGAPVYTAEGGPRRDGKIRGENEIKPVDSPDHFLNWLQSMVKNDPKACNAQPDAGLQHSVATIMAQMSYETGSRTKWDAEKRTIVKG